MKKTILLLSLILSAFNFSISAQDDNFSSSRLNNLVNNLKRQTVDLVDRTSEDLRRSRNNSRSDIETAFLAQQLDASVGFFDQLVRDNRRGSELRDAASILTDLARRAPSYGSSGYLWRDVQNSINDINRELGGVGGGGGNNGGGNNGGNDTSQVIGRAYWRGTVDSIVRIEIQGKNLGVNTISGSTYGSGTFSFTSPLPNRNASVGVDKKKGRGDVRIIQQPNRSNNFTAIIEIEDGGGGAREYQLEIYWR